MRGPEESSAACSVVERLPSPDDFESRAYHRQYRSARFRRSSAAPLSASEEPHITCGPAAACPQQPQRQRTGGRIRPQVSRHEIVMGTAVGNAALVPMSRPQVKPLTRHGCSICQRAGELAAELRLTRRQPTSTPPRTRATRKSGRGRRAASGDPAERPRAELE